MTASTPSTRPNFFLLLGLNPDAPWNQTLFEETLRKKRNEWSRQGAGVAKKALLAKQNLALIPKITEVMMNAELREQEAIAARKERVAEQQKEQAQFEKQLTFINAQDTLDEEEIENFVAAFQHLVPAEEIKSRIKVPTPTPETEAASAQATATLEESIAKNIADRLQIIHMSTLYELLAQDIGSTPGTGSAQDTGSTPSTPPPTWDLLRAAEALYARLVRLQPTAETTAKMELAGLARYVFKSDETRASYDETLRQASWQRIFHELDESMSRAKKKEVNAKQITLFLNDAQKDGWPEQEALEQLKEHAQQQKWHIVVPAHEPTDSVPPVLLDQKNPSGPLDRKNLSVPLDRGNASAPPEHRNASVPLEGRNASALLNQKNASVPPEQGNTPAPLERGNLNDQTRPTEEKLVCPNCKQVNKKDFRYCTNCKQPLYIDCPQCKQRVAADSSACGNCGFAVGNRSLVDNLLTDLHNQLQKGNLKRAEEIATEAERMWPAPQDDARYQQIANAKAAVKRLYAAHQQARKVSHESQLTLTFTEIDPSGTTANQNVNTPHCVRLTWSPLQEKGQGFVGAENASTPICYAIVKSEKPLGQAGKVITEAEVAGQGYVLPIREEDPPNTRIDYCKPFVITYYTPIVVIQQQAYVGHSQSYLCVENVSDLTSQYLGSTIRLRWRWPQASQEVLVSYRRQEWPQHHDANATTCVLTRETYEQLGYYDLRGPIDYDCYMLISTVATYEKTPFIASGVRLVMRMGTRITLTYEIIQPTFLRKQRMLHIIIDSPTAIPPLQLVSKQGQIPLRKADGEIFYRIAEIGGLAAIGGVSLAPNRREVMIPLPEKAVPPRMYGKLFLEDDTLYRDFLIHHPSATMMRLS